MGVTSIAHGIHPVKEDSPMKRGLKSARQTRAIETILVKEDSPMKRGLK